MFTPLDVCNLQIIWVKYGLSWNAAEDFHTWNNFLKSVSPCIYKETKPELFSSDDGHLSFIYFLNDGIGTVGYTGIFSRLEFPSSIINQSLMSYKRYSEPIYGTPESSVFF